MPAPLATSSLGGWTAGPTRLTAEHEGIPVLNVYPDFKRVGIKVDEFLSIDSQFGGRAVPWADESGTRRIVTLPFLFGNRAQSKAFRVFVNWRRGAQLFFWLPLWTSLARMAADADAGATGLVIEDARLAELFEAGERFRHLAIFSPDGLFEAHRISGVDSHAAGERITLDTPVVQALSYRAVAVCPMMLARFPAEIDYEYLSAEVCSVRVQFLEVVAIGSAIGNPAGAEPVRLPGDPLSPPTIPPDGDNEGETPVFGGSPAGEFSSLVARMDALAGSYRLYAGPDWTPGDSLTLAEQNLAYQLSVNHAAQLAAAYATAGYSMTNVTAPYWEHVTTYGCGSYLFAKILSSVDPSDGLGEQTICGSGYWQLHYGFDLV